MGPEDVVYGNKAWIWSIKNRGERPEIRMPMPILFGRGVSNILTLIDILKANKYLTGGQGGVFTLKYDDKEEKLKGNAELRSFVKTNEKEIKSMLEKKGVLRLVSAIPNGDS